MEIETTNTASADTLGKPDSRSDTELNSTYSNDAEIMSADILMDARDLITGSRADDYGDALVNHQRIANGWNLILTDALRTHGRISPAHVALMLDWMKTSRLLTSINHKDSWVDKCGYSALGGSIAEAMNGQQ